MSVQIIVLLSLQNLIKSLNESKLPGVNRNEHEKKHFAKYPPSRSSCSAGGACWVLPMTGLNLHRPLPSTWCFSVSSPFRYGAGESPAIRLPSAWQDTKCQRLSLAMVAGGATCHRLKPETLKPLRSAMERKTSVSPTCWLATSGSAADNPIWRWAITRCPRSIMEQVVCFLDYDRVFEGWRFPFCETVIVKPEKESLSSWDHWLP